ncbi:MAG: cysteine peptidase family C39 domain-containing protein [Bacteroidota bacterium]
MTPHVKGNLPSKPPGKALALIFVVAGSAALLAAAISVRIATKENRKDFILQERANTCGVAAMKMVLDAYGIHRTMADIESELRPSQKGLSMLALKRFAQQTGLFVQGWRLSAEELSTIPKPAVLFVQGSHYCILDSVDRSQYFFRDPAFGAIQMTEEDLQKVWNGETLVFSNTVQNKFGEGF